MFFSKSEYHLNSKKSLPAFCKGTKHFSRRKPTPKIRYFLIAYSGYTYEKKAIIFSSLYCGTFVNQNELRRKQIDLTTTMENCIITGITELSKKDFEEFVK